MVIAGPEPLDISHPPAHAGRAGDGLLQLVGLAELYAISTSPQEFVLMSELPADGLTIRELQRRIFELYGAKDKARGDSATFLWLAEEFGELATALRRGRPRSWPWRWPTSSPGW